MINRRRRTTPRTVVRRRRARAASRRRPRARPTTGGAAETRGPVSSRLGGRACHGQSSSTRRRRRRLSDAIPTDQPPHPSCSDRCCCRSCVWCCWMDGSESEGLLGRFAKAVGLKPAAKEADLGQKMEAYFDKVGGTEGGSRCCCCCMLKKCLPTHWWLSVGWVSVGRWVGAGQEPVDLPRQRGHGGGRGPGQQAAAHHPSTGPTYSSAAAAATSLVLSCLTPLPPLPAAGGAVAVGQHHVPECRLAGPWWSLPHVQRTPQWRRWPPHRRARGSRGPTHLGRPARR